MRCCFTIASQSKVSFKISVYHSLFCLMDCLVQARSLSLLRHNGRSLSVQRTHQLLNTDERRQLWATVYLADPLQQAIWLLGRMIPGPIVLLRRTSSVQSTTSPTPTLFARTDMTAIYSIQAQWDLAMKNKQRFVFSLLNALCGPKSGTGIHCALQSPAWSPQKRASQDQTDTKKRDDLILQFENPQLRLL